jgi:hypothetical protein
MYPQGIPVGACPYLLTGLLPLPGMQTDDRLRKRVWKLINIGVGHKVIAGKMGMPPSTFSKWLHKRKGSGPATLNHLDGFERYWRELRDTVMVREETAPYGDKGLEEGEQKDKPPQPDAAGGGRPAGRKPHRSR